MYCFFRSVFTHATIGEHGSPLLYGSYFVLFYSQLIVSNVTLGHLWLCICKTVCTNLGRRHAVSKCLVR